MENLTLEQINELIAAEGSDITATASEFRQINASNEGHYRITYNVNDEEANNSIFVTQKEDGSFRASINTLIYSV